MTDLMTADQLEAALRQIGAERYHSNHPFHKRLHSGELTRAQVQAWALNRFYYQAMIPVKDSAIMARMTDPICAENGGRGWSTMTARARATAASSAG